MKPNLEHYLTRLRYDLDGLDIEDEADWLLKASDIAKSKALHIRQGILNSRKAGCNEIFGDNRNHTT